MAAQSPLGVIPMRSDSIACENCAHLKVTCDKNVPCRKCVDRAIVCKPRYSRRKHANEAAIAEHRDAAHVTQHGHGTSSYHNSLASRKIPLSIAPQHSYDPTVPAGQPLSAAWEHANGAKASNNNAFASGQNGQASLALTSPEDTLYDSYQNNANLSAGGPVLKPPDTSFAPLAASVGLSSADGQTRQWTCDNFAYDIESWMPDDFNVNVVAQQPSQWSGVLQSPYYAPAAAHKRRHTGDILTAAPMLRNSPEAINGPSPPRSETKQGYSIKDAEKQWTTFRCNPQDPAYDPIMVARHSLAGLSLSDGNYLEQTNFKSRIPVEFLVHGIDSLTRDKIVAINYSFAERALRLHRIAPLPTSVPTGPDDDMDREDKDDGIISLPSSAVMQNFLNAYVLRIEHSYPSISGSALRPNELIKDNAKHRALHFFLMIAIGSMAGVTPAGKNMSNALTETCRVRLYEVLERRQRLDANTIPLVIRAAVLFSLLAGWSGQKFYMDLAMAQQGLYMPMIRQSKIWDDCEFDPEDPAHCCNPELMWKDWLQKEHRKRLVYSCITVFLESSILFDAPCPITMRELEQSEPSSDWLWSAANANSWLQVYHKVKDNPKPSTLLTFCRNVTLQQMEHLPASVTPLQLSYCLHIVTVLSYHVMQLQENLPLNGGCRTGSKLLQPAQEELSSLMSAWYRLARLQKLDCAEYSLHAAAMRSNFLKFHIVNLNTVSRFPSIETIARDGPSWDAAQRLGNCIKNGAECWAQVGQILRVLRDIALPVRPLWWAAGLYRTALVAWAASMSHASHNVADDHAQRQHDATDGATLTLQSNIGMTHSKKPHDDNSIAAAASKAVLAVDDLQLEEPQVTLFREHQVGTPVLTRTLTGELVSPAEPLEILRIFVDELSNDDGLDFVVGIRKKLSLMMLRWTP